jgi:predicted Fe-Mo cluster-binding NifX family protein
MRVGISDYEDRVSPVFDVATHLTLVEYREKEEVNRVGYSLEVLDPYERVKFLEHLQLDALICGAISRPLELLLTEKGIAVYAQVCGNIAQVLQAFVAGNLSDPCFRLPGCQRGGRHQWRRGRCRRYSRPGPKEMP